MSNAVLEASQDDVPPSPDRATRKLPAHAAVAERLRRDIQYCRWVAGQWLKQADLEAEYAASRSEVRGALVEMQRLGLVVHELNCGYRVVPADPVRRTEIRTTRAVLESATVEGVLANATQEDVALLRDLATRFATRAGAVGLPELMVINQQFHSTIYALCGNSFLANLIGELRERGMSISVGRWTTTQGLHATAQEHLAMVDAIEAQDAPGLRALITRHVNAF
jgi:DNA-binding GntR family transcriptional regulator